VPSAQPAMQDSGGDATRDHTEPQNSGGMPAKGRGRGGRGAPVRGGRGPFASRPESRSQQVERWGHKPLPPEPVVPDSGRHFGVVVTVKETFGFIK